MTKEKSVITLTTGWHNGQHLGLVLEQGQETLAAPTSIQVPMS
jgi:hypothetical protein